MSQMRVLGQKTRGGAPNAPPPAFIGLIQLAGKAFKGIQREEVLAFVNFRELKDNTYQDTQPQQTKDIQE